MIAWGGAMKSCFRVVTPTTCQPSAPSVFSRCSTSLPVSTTLYWKSRIAPRDDACTVAMTCTSSLPSASRLLANAASRSSPIPCGRSLKDVAPVHGRIDPVPDRIPLLRGQRPRGMAQHEPHEHVLLPGSEPDAGDCLRRQPGRRGLAHD